MQPKPFRSDRGEDSVGRDDVGWRLLVARKIGQMVAYQLIRRGFSPGQAEARARVAYAAYLGNRMLMHSSGTGKRPDSAALKREFLAAIQGCRPGR